MSRCFPFPPPGYEKKPSNIHEDLLIKEKQKEKRHRKEKRNKEKKEKEERKDKGHIKDKHREKKDKKGKHKDKDNKKHKDKAKDKKNNLNERKVEGYTGDHNEGSLVERMHGIEYLKDPKFSEEFGKKNRDEEKGNQIVSKLQRTYGSMGSSAEKKAAAIKVVTGNKTVHNINAPDPKMHVASTVGKGRKDDEMHQNGAGNRLVEKIIGKVQRELGSTGNPEEKKCTGNQVVAGNKMVQNLTMPDQKMHLVGVMEKKAEMLHNGVGRKPVEKTSDAEKVLESMGSSGERKGAGNKLFSGNKMAQNISVQDQKLQMASGMEKGGTACEMLQENDCGGRRINDMGRPVVQAIHQKIEGKGRIAVQELDGHREKNREKVQKEGNKEREKEKKKEKERKKEKRKEKHKEKVKEINIQKKEHEDSPKVESLFISEDKSLKRKHINGFLHADEMRSSKFPRSSSSNQLPLENGRKLGESLTGSPSADSHKPMNLVKMEKLIPEENKINGVIESQPPAAVLGQNSGTTKVVEGLKRLPHPDEKYLSEVLSVPKMDQWPEYDDQYWLLGRGNAQQGPKTTHSTDESRQVWATALRIEAADVLALPYVVPY